MRPLIIGLDGATWMVIDSLLKDGRLPNLACLIEHGTRCASTAIEPAQSPVVWTSLARQTAGEAWRDLLFRYG